MSPIRFSSQLLGHQVIYEGIYVKLKHDQHVSWHLLKTGNGGKGTRECDDQDLASFADVHVAIHRVMSPSARYRQLAIWFHDFIDIAHEARVAGACFLSWMTS